MYTTPAVIRINHPIEGQYTVLSVHGTMEEAQVELVNKSLKQEEVKIEYVDPDMKGCEVGDMTDFHPSRMKIYRHDQDIDHDI